MTQKKPRIIRTTAINELGNSCEGCIGDESFELCSSLPECTGFTQEGRIESKWIWVYKEEPTDAN